jgi:hypothetical protein
MKNFDPKSMLAGGALASAVLLLTSATRLPVAKPDPTTSVLVESLLQSQRIQAEAWEALANNGLALNMPDSHTLNIANYSYAGSRKPFKIEMDNEISGEITTR